MLQAYSDSELLSVLSDIDVSVPRRSEGRTKEHTERYAIAHLLSALAGKGRLSYPLCLIRRERPDFVLTLETVQIGIEHTEAVPQNEAHRTVLREKGNGPDVFFISHHQPGETKKSAKELVEGIKANQAGDGWAGDSVETEWVNAMSHIIGQKVATLRKDGFDKFEQDWLLIYDNWPLPAVDRHKAANFLWELVNEYGVLNEFARIYIITGKYVLEVSNERIQLFEINDLWK
ncbi:MAG TPA: hypothetical protein VI457_02250 [Methylococcaceae bacterium]|nr:hypothetical protein [Methylococcaceae bacterium]